MPEMRISFLLNTVVREMNSQADALLRQEFGITYSQFVFLMITSEHPRIDVTGLAKELGVTKGAVSKRVEWFVERGFALSQHPPGDLKRVQISLTKSGVQLAMQAGSFLDKTFMSTISTNTKSNFDVLAIELQEIYTRLLHRKEELVG
jgi:DNA-binding MarR family transcriptional regulator